MRRPGNLGNFADTGVHVPKDREPRGLTKPVFKVTDRGILNPYFPGRKNIITPTIKHRLNIM